MITIQEYQRASDALEGYCLKCKEFTRSMTEPDARGYECPQCETKSVIGAGEALIEGFVCDDAPAPKAKAKAPKRKRRIPKAERKRLGFSKKELKALLAIADNPERESIHGLRVDTQQGRLVATNGIMMFHAFALSVVRPDVPSFTINPFWLSDIVLKRKGSSRYQYRICIGDQGQLWLATLDDCGDRLDLDEILTLDQPFADFEKITDREIDHDSVVKIGLGASALAQFAKTCEPFTDEPLAFNFQGDDSAIVVESSSLKAWLMPCRLD